jgi:N-acetylglucosaminyldiphosphoundecaprenol N-acetyl-beta-D-mannosaminyltransferase
MNSSADAMGTSASIPCERLRILGAPVDNVSMREALERIETFIRERIPRQHVSINVHKLVMLQRDAQLREVVQTCDLATADGQPVVWAARLLGQPIKGRITGIDLMENLVSVAAEKGYRVYFLGGPREVVSRAVEQYGCRYPKLQIAGWADGYWAPTEEAGIVSAIAAARPDILFVALDSPRKENFIHRHREHMQVPFAMGVGGAFAVGAGMVRRAPRWVQRTGLEWLWRVAQEPVRLSKRYSADGIAFVSLLLREWFNGPRH